MNLEKDLEIWGGIECTINRVGDQYFDQCEYSGHYRRGTDDIDLVASLGVKMLRYPVLWERHQSIEGAPIDWSFTQRLLEHARAEGIQPIAGLVHHGSGPVHVNFFDGSFEEGLAGYASQVAKKFPWLEYYTPVNEPLTTARFCGLYGHWYPHGKTDYTFFKILLSECKATVMAMQEIRQINPSAKLIQTEDLGKCYSTPLLAYQAKMENHRRWLSYDLLCGRVDQQHFMWKYLIKAGIKQEEILYFKENPCVPHIAGFNYYITSERFLDESLEKYPAQYHGGNGLHQYADIETVLVPMKEDSGPAVLLKEAWEHLHLPLAITECHLHSTREDQMRWFHSMWNTANTVRAEGVDLRAITAWAIFGLYGWNCLVTKPCGDYEPGIFNLRSGYPTPTALARLIQELTKHKVYYHPVLENEGWWQRNTRKQYGINKVVSIKRRRQSTSGRPLLILGKTATLGRAFSRICEERNIHHLLLSRADLDLTDAAAMKEVIHELHPWGIVNAAGYSNIEEAEKEMGLCFDVNCCGPAQLAELCKQADIRFLSFSTGLVFDGEKGQHYVESDSVNPISIFGKSKAMAESEILNKNEDALIIRSGTLFSPWDKFNFVARTLAEFREGRSVKVPDDVVISAAYVPDLVHHSIDLLLDGASGIHHMSSEEAISWAELARKVAYFSGHDAALVKAVPQYAMRWKAKRPSFSALKSEKGSALPCLDSALGHCFEVMGYQYQSGRVAV